MRSARVWTALAVALMLLGPTSEARADGGVLRFSAPVYKTKTTKAGTTYTPLKLAKGSFELNVQLLDGPVGMLLHEETLGFTVRSDAPSDPSLLAFTVAGKLAGLVDVVLGADVSDPLPAGLASSDVWFTTQVTLFSKQGNSTTYEPSPAQPLGLSGYTRGLDLAPRSLDVEQELRAGSLVLPKNVTEGYVLTAEVDGTATWQPADVAINAIGSEQVLDESLTADDLGPASVLADEIGTGAVGSDELADGAVVAAKLAPASVSSAALAPDSVGSAQLLPGSVTASELAANAVGSPAIANGSVQTADLADGSIITVKLDTKAVTTEKLATSAVTSTQILNGTITASDMASGAIGTPQIVDGAVTGAKIANGTITSLDLASGSVDSAELATDAVTGAKVADDAISAVHLASNSVTASAVAANAISSDEIQDFTLQGGDVSTYAGEIYHGEMAGIAGPNEFMQIEVGPVFSSGGADAVDIQAPADASSGFSFFEMNVGSDRRIALNGTGDGYCDGSWNGGGADYADLVRVPPGARSVEPGDVLVLDRSANRAVCLATSARSTLVAGVYSTSPAFVGWGSRESDLPHPDEALLVSQGLQPERTSLDVSDVARLYDEVPLALVGIVPCKVSAENGAIQRGDLLVTSWTPGHAMRDDAPRPGTIVGKAMGELRHGTGVIEVLVTLQ